MVSATDKGDEMLSLLIAQCHCVFLYRDLFPGHQSAPQAGTEPSSQTNAAESMTGATSIKIVALPFRTTRTTTSRCPQHDPGARHRPAGVGQSCAAARRAGRSAVLCPHSRASGSGTVSLARRPAALVQADRLMDAEHSHEL